MIDGKLISDGISLVERVGGLTPAAIFAMISIGEGVYIYKKYKSDDTAQEKWRMTRESAIHAEEQQTEAFKAVASQVVTLGVSHNNLVHEVSRLTTLIEERIPRR